MNKLNSSVLYRNDLLVLTGKGNNKKVTQEINRLVTYGKNLGIGSSSGQKLMLDSNNLNLLKKASNWWIKMSLNEAPCFRTSRETSVMQKILLTSLQGNKPLSFILILCPAYKKGAGEHGLKEQLGKTTFSRIDFSYEILRQTRDLGINCKLEIWYSDIILENYSKLSDEYWNKAIEKNFNQIRTYLNSINSSIVLRRLSEVGKLGEEIGRKGIEKESSIPKEIIKIATERSGLFYKNALGWGKEAVAKRMKILAYAYEAIGKAFKEEGFSIMIFGENMYERGRMYSGDQDIKNIISIIYPKKGEE